MPKLLCELNLRKEDAWKVRRKDERLLLVFATEKF
jgi:hypothetical protein